MPDDAPTDAPPAPGGVEYTVGDETFTVRKRHGSRVTVSLSGRAIAEIVRNGRYWYVHGIDDGDRATSHRSFGEALTAASSRY